VQVLEATPTPAASNACASWGIEGLSLGIALSGPTAPETWARQLDWVDRAEALGLHSAWLPEMHFAPGSCPSPLLGLSAIAARTRRLRVGTSSLLLPIHSPLRVAQTAALVDRLSGGRLLLGLGRGFRPALFHAFGIDASSKRDRFDSALDLILEYWAGRIPSLAGTPFEGDEHDLPAELTRGQVQTPAQTPHPPLAVAAFGRKGLHQAARRGLPYLASPLEPLPLLEENLDYHREHMPDLAGPQSRVVPIMRVVHVATDDAEVARVVGALEAEGKQLRGTSGRLPKALARAASAPIEQRCIVGMRSEVIDRIGDYREKLGMNLLITRPQLRGIDHSAQLASLERLAEEVG